MPCEIQGKHIEAAPSDFDADRVSAVGPQCDRHRGLSDPSAHARLLVEQTVIDEPIDDHRHALHAEPREPPDVGFRKGPVQAYRLQHDALVELPHADLVRPDRARQLRLRSSIHT
ncbi:hypothetical protein LMG24076_01746 [Trinickia soli]|nr:hypothetical protein LMG24076_01746 [Trinickia soli]